MDYNDNGELRRTHPVTLANLPTQSKKVPSHSGCPNGVTASLNQPTDSKTRPWNVDNGGIATVTDQQANVKCADDNSQCCAGLLTWKDLSPTHHRRSNGTAGTAPSGGKVDQEKVLTSWGQKQSQDKCENSRAENSVITWKQLSPTKLKNTNTKNRTAFGFSSPESSDSDTVRHSPVPIPSAPPMQESSSDASVASPTHGARSSGAGSDGSTYLPSPEDGFSNDYFYDEDFSVQFDTNLKDSLLDTVPSEGVSTPSILEFSDTMTIDVNETSSTVDGSVRASQCESEISGSDRNSAEMSTSEREMMCSSDLLQISDGPLFTPTPTNEIPSHISTDSLDKGARGMNGSASTADASKIYVDCGTKKELYMLSFFTHRGKQTTSLASVMSQGSWSSDQQGSRSHSNCTSQDDLEGSVSASLQTHVDYGNHRTSSRHSGKPGSIPCRSHSENSCMNRRHMTSQATSTDSMDGADVGSAKHGRLTSWRNVKQRRKLTSKSEDAPTKDKSKSKSMPDLHMQNWLDRMSGCTEESEAKDVAGSAADALKGSTTSLMEIYQKMKTDRFSDQSLSEGNMLGSEGKDSVFLDKESLSAEGVDKPSVLPQRPAKLPHRYYTYSSESETSVDVRQMKLPVHCLDQKFTCVQTSPQTSEPGGYRGHTLPRTYKRSLSSPARCLHNCPSSFSLTGNEKETQCPPHVLSEPVITWKGTKNFSAQFPPNTRDCGIQTNALEKDHVLTDREMQTSPDKAYGAFPSQKTSCQQTASPQTSPTRLSRSAQVRRAPDSQRCAMVRPHSIGPIGDDEDRMFPTYDAVVQRCALREKRGSSLSPSRPNKQSFYSHRSLPDLSFLTDRSPISSPVHHAHTEPRSCPPLETKPVFFTPRVGGAGVAPPPNCGLPHKVPQNFHPFPYYPHLQQQQQHVCMRQAEAVEGLDINAPAPRQVRQGRSSRAGNGGKSRSGHAPQSASSSSGFSTSSTSSGIDPGYHDNRHSPPMAEQFQPGFQVWDSRHKFIETDGGCVYYHSLPNHLPPSFICEEEKMDFYSCMCVKPPVAEAKMFSYKYEQYPETHQNYLPSSKPQEPPPEGPAQDGGQELILDTQSSSSGMGTNDDMYSVHENETSSSPENGANQDGLAKNFCATEVTEAVLASNGVVLRRGRTWQHSDQGSNDTDSPRGSSDNLSGGNSSGSGGEDRKPLKSCLRRRKLERRCRSMSLSDPFRLYEGYFAPGPRVAKTHRHSYACDGHPLYMDCLYENLDSSQFADMMEWYRQTYMADLHGPIGSLQCACAADPPVVMRQEKQPSGDLGKISGGSSGSLGCTFTLGETTPSENDDDDDSMEKKEKRKSVSFASEVSFHSPLPSPQCSPKRQQSESPTPQGAGNQVASPESQAEIVNRLVPHPAAWPVTQEAPERLVPTAPLHVSVNSQDSEDSCNDAPPSEFAVMSPRGMGDSHRMDNTTCMEKKRVYLADVARAAGALVDHFSQSKTAFDKLRLGSSVDTPEVGQLVMSQLCPAIARIISDGLKPYTSGLHVFGRIQITVWRVAEVSAELGPSTRAVHDLVKDLRNRSDLVSTRQKFEAFIFGLLNLRLLDFWMGYTRHKDKVVGKLYEPDSILCLSHTTVRRQFDEMLVSLQPLAVLPFQLDASFIVAFHSNNKLSVDGSLDDKTHFGHTDSQIVTRSKSKEEISSKMDRSQPSTSNKTSWSWLGGSYMSNTLPRARSLVSNMAQHWSPAVGKLHKKAVRSLTMFSSGSSTSSVGPCTTSPDKLEQCLPRNKGELFIAEGNNMQSGSSSISESSVNGKQKQQACEHSLASLQNFPQEASSEDSQTESSHGMSKFASKLYKLAAGKIESVAPAYRRGVTEYYFEGDNENGSTPKAHTPGTESSCSGSESQGSHQTWRDVKKTRADDTVIPPPKPPRSLHMQYLEKPSSTSMSSATSASSVSSNASSPSKSKTSFDLIRLFDKLLLPSNSNQQKLDPSNPPPKPKRWSWTPLGNRESLREFDVEADHYRSVSTFKTDASKPTSSVNCADPEKTKTVTEKVAEAEKSANQITLADGPVLTLPPPCAPKRGTAATPPTSGCYAGIVQSDKLTLSLTADPSSPPQFDEVDGNANIVRSADQFPINLCSGANSQAERSSSSNQSTPSAQSANQQCTSSHVPRSSANQAPRMADDDSSSDTDQSKSSFSSDQSEASTPAAASNEASSDKFKLPEYRYVETLTNRPNADVEDHMTYSAGEFLEVLAQLDTDWLFCVSGKREGLVRLADVKPVMDAELFKTLHSDFYN